MKINERNIKTEIKLKNLSQNQRVAIDCMDGEVVRETEKAYQIEWSTDYGKVRMWTPKSCVENVQEADDQSNGNDYYFTINFLKRIHPFAKLFIHNNDGSKVEVNSQLYSKKCEHFEYNEVEDALHIYY